MAHTSAPPLQPLSLAILLAFAGAAGAQTAHLPSVIIMGPAAEGTQIDAFSSNSSVVSQNQLRDLNANDLSSALRNTTGVQTVRSNPVGGGTDAQVLIRGMGASRPGSEIKTYIDDIPFYMGVWNHPLLDLLPLNGMQSVTVYKSPQPQINGNNFASVNLRSKRATQDGVHGDGSLSFGSYSTVVEQANLTGRQGDLDYALAQGRAQSDGHRPNADGETNNLMGHVGMRLNPNWSAGVGFIALNNKGTDPGDNRLPVSATPERFKLRASTVSANVAHQHGDWQGDVRIYSNTGQGDLFNQAPPNGDYLTHFSMSGLRWTEQVSPWSGGTVVAGLDHDRLRGNVHFNWNVPMPPTYFDSPTFKVTSPHVAVSQKIALNPSWTLVPSAGVRFYDHNVFASKTAPHAGVTLSSDKVSVFANVARGINYPGLETAAVSAGMPMLGTTWKSLAAEELNHTELGAKFALATGTQIDVSVFEDKVKNRYVFGFPPDVPPPPQFLNLGAYRMRGSELSVRQEITKGWSAFGGLALLDPSIDNLPYSPKRALNAGVLGQVGPVRVVLDAQHQSEVWALDRSRTVGDTNTTKVDGFTVVNARVSYALPALGKQGEVFLAVENLFDKDYAYRPGYPMPGRWGQIGLSASF